MMLMMVGFILLPAQVDVLLDRGCNSWSTNKGGESALDLACRFGHVHVRILSTVIELHVIILLTHIYLLSSSLVA